MRLGSGTSWRVVPRHSIYIGAVDTGPNPFARNQTIAEFSPGILVQKSCRFFVADFYLEVLVVFYRLLWVTKNRHKKSAVRLGFIFGVLVGVDARENSAMV